MDTAKEPENTAGSGIYVKDGLTEEFRQGEILTGVIQHVYVDAEKAVRPVVHAFAIIASQDCDLLQEYNAIRKGNPGDINSILLYEMRLFVELPSFFPTATDRKVKNRICQNNDERFQYLCEAHANFDTEGKGYPN
jgi:hypothetical protein